MENMEKLLLFTPIFVCAFGSCQDTISPLSQNLCIDSTTASHMLTKNTSLSALYLLPNTFILVITAQ